MEENVNNMKLSAPWETKKNMLKALFGQDPDIEVVCEDRAVKLLVNNPVKAEALDCLLPCEYEFGNEKLEITVVPGNGSDSAAALYRCAFEGNPVFSYSSPKSWPGGGGGGAYVVFKNAVAQFFNDDLSDVNGNWSGLYADLAREAFPDAGSDGTSFCTDVPGDLGKPLGEWP